LLTKRLVHLRTLLVIANTDVTLGVESVGPESTEVNVGLGHALVAKEEPKTENRLSEDIENSVGDDLGVNAGLAGAVGDTPDTVKVLVIVELQ